MACCGTDGRKEKVQDVSYPGPIQPTATVSLPPQDLRATPSAEQERDFVRIFQQQGIYLLNEEEVDPVLLQHDKKVQDPDDIIENFLGLLRDHDPARNLKDFTDEELRRYVAKHISVSESFDFCMREQLAPLFLQPVYLVLLTPQHSAPGAGIVVVIYGFVAEAAKGHLQVVGDRPETKRTPWIARLELNLRDSTLTHTVFPQNRSAAFTDSNSFMMKDLDALRAKYFRSSPTS
ncbi:unnamed protein product [Amoebophrya sp. A120]|nr:unnamed protein product [Amoebophrya sp. A120]|eukprot:GSA120T00002466001.1